MRLSKLRLVVLAILTAIKFLVITIIHTVENEGTAFLIAKCLVESFKKYR